MNVKELLDELTKCDPAAVVSNADGSEIDEVQEDGDEVTLFCEDDEDESAEPVEDDAIDAEFVTV